MSQNSNEDAFPGKPLGDGLYEVDLSKIDDLVIYRPCMPNYDSADMATAPSEFITATTTLEPVDVVIFYDRFSRHPLSEGCNQWAFVVDSQRALFNRYCSLYPIEPTQEKAKRYSDKTYPERISRARSSIFDRVPMAAATFQSRDKSSPMHQLHPIRIGQLLSARHPLRHRWRL